MPDTPRFSDHQVRLILARAAQDALARDTHAEGRTLADLEQIAAEAGIPAEAVRRAAAIVRSGGDAPLEITATALGIPSGMARRLPMGRRIKDRDWSRIVAQLRVLRGARGSLRDDEGLREWRHQGLRVFVQETDDGDVIHLTARDDHPLELTGIGTLIGGAGVALTALFLLLPADEKARVLWVLGAGIAALGAGFAAWGVLALRDWSNAHRRLIDRIAQELPPLLRNRDERER
jgi:hypothetical protein